MSTGRTVECRPALWERRLKTVTEPARQTPLVDRYDVIVAGGGTAGIVAAVAAARNGARVLLLERSGFLGGNIATQFLEHSAGWFDARGNAASWVALPEELVKRLVAAGASPGHVRDDTGYTRYRVPVNHEEFKSEVTAWIAEAGVDFLLFSPICAYVATVPAPSMASSSKTNPAGRPMRQEPLSTAQGTPMWPRKPAAIFCRNRVVPTQPVSLLFKLGGIDHARASRLRRG